MGLYRNCVRFHSCNIRHYFVGTIRNVLNLAWSIVALITSPVWWFPVKLVIKIMEPYGKKRREKAISEHMDRMFPRKKPNK